MENDWLALLKKSHAILEGHFLLSSGLHSDTYFQMALVFRNPAYGEKCACGLAKRFSGQKIDTVVGPALGGILLSYELGRILKANSIFSEREQGEMILRRGFRIKPGEKVLVCEDVITTGGSVKEVINLVEKAGGNIVGVACLVERGRVDLGYRLESLLKVQAEAYQPSECPLCRDNVPLVKPGSRQISKKEGGT